MNYSIEAPFINKLDHPVVAGDYINPVGSKRFFTRFKPNGITDNRDEWKQKWADTVYEYSFTTYWESLNTKRMKAICKYMITGDNNWRVNDSKWIYSDGYNPQKAGKLSKLINKT